MRTINAKYRSLCHECKDSIEVGTEVLYDDAIKKVFHVNCVQQEELPIGDAMQLADELGFE